MQLTASIPFVHMADLELGSDVWSQAVVLGQLGTSILIYMDTFSYISAISWRPVLVVEEARVPGQPPTIRKQVVNFINRVYGIKYKYFMNLKVLPSYYYFLFYQHWQFLLKWTDSLLYNSKPNLAEMFSMRSYTRVVTFVHKKKMKMLFPHRVSMQTLTSAGGHFEFSNGANSNNTY
jgi:hypothetical protein